MELERADAEREAARAKATREAAAALDRDAEVLGERVTKALAPHVAAWQKDLEVVAAGKQQDAAKDPALVKYRVDRALAHLAAPLEAALTRLWPAAPATRLGVRSIARGAVRTFAVSSRDFEAPIESLVSSALATLGEALTAAAVAVRPAASVVGRVRELRVLASALT
jgi:hypothetical protein